VKPEIDIWRAAQLMLKRDGDQAFKESAARADEFALAGNGDGAATWRRSWVRSPSSPTPLPGGQCSDRERLTRGRPYRNLNHYARQFYQGINPQNGE
jgi:hypothetical protein